jgi:hypothetical protein
MAAALVQRRRPHPPTVGGISEPAPEGGGLLTKMGEEFDSESRRRFRGALGRAPALSPLSLSSRSPGGAVEPRLQPRSVRTDTTKTLAPPGPRASVNISAHDSWAEGIGSPSWARCVNPKREKSDSFHRKEAFKSPQDVGSVGTGPAAIGSTLTRQWTLGSSFMSWTRSATRAPSCVPHQLPVKS